MKYPRILAIDTSCDDTSVAVTQGMKVLSNIVASQTEIHRKYGGVMPLEAKLAHHEFIGPTYHEALKRAHIKSNQIDAVAVTYGPGLAIALEVGIAFAKDLSKELNVPLIGVNHMSGHLYSCLAVNSKGNTKPKVTIEGEFFPALALLISGGHSDIVLLPDLSTPTIVGATIDDAAGEALDKFARLLDLGYPGGAILETIAKEGNPDRFQFPLPMTQTHDFNLSFSGLKTSGRHKVEELEGTLDQQTIEDLAASFQKAVFRALLYKFKKAVEKFQPQSIWLGGGVSANLYLRKQMRDLCKQNNIKLIFPYTKKLSTDNAAMIGVAAYFQYLNKDFVFNFDEFQRKPRLNI